MIPYDNSEAARQEVRMRMEPTLTEFAESIRQAREAIARSVTFMQSEEAARVDGFALAILAETGGKPSDFAMHVGTNFDDGKMTTTYRFIRINS